MNRIIPFPSIVLVFLSKLFLSVIIKAAVTSKVLGLLRHPNLDHARKIEPLIVSLAGDYVTLPDAFCHYR